MRATPFKWLLIGLIVVAMAGLPWAQAFASFSSQGCGGDHSAKSELAHATTVQSPVKIAMATTAKNDFGAATNAACAKSCAAMQVFGALAAAWLPEVWPQIHSEAIDFVLSGHPPKPELSPPIALA
jgi:hypothetical protein